MKYNKKTFKALENLYSNYHKREFISPDPLEFLYKYEDVRDREIVGLIASSLAIGRVNMILNAVGRVLEIIPSPFSDLMKIEEKDIKVGLAGFKYRFYDENRISAFLIGIKRLLESFGSLESAFNNFERQQDKTYVNKLEDFACRIIDSASDDIGTLVSLPSRGSACKRLNLFMRWMVRKDNIDRGGWNSVKTSDLIIPLDVHMHKVAMLLGLNNRKQADLKSAINITESLKLYDSNDPVRYDFSLTRPGIHPELNELAVISAARKIA